MTTSTLLRARHAVELYGHGQVGRALISLLEEHRIPVAAIHDSKGVVNRFDVESQKRVFVDVTAPRYHGPYAWKWVNFLVDRLHEGTPLVTANKAPLAIGWHRLRGAAEEGGTTIHATATVGGGTPILPTIHRLRCSHGIRRIEATLSGTLGFVLARVAAGATLNTAIWDAQEAGFAEPDPRLDLDGIDVRAKAQILHNAAFPDDASPLFQADRRAVELDTARIRELVLEGRTPQVVATIEPGHIQVALVGLRFGDPLASGTGSACIRVTTSNADEIVLNGPGAGPETTARAVVGDILEVFAR